jgi:tRNA threonylcarbamoyladenosine modification (KEOPS) complex  Pcc1 subunit
LAVGFEMNANATIRLRFPSRQQLSAVFEALEPETRCTVTGRSKVAITRDDKALMLTLIFTARDTSALRAAVNSYLHWARLTMDALESVDQSRNA